MINLRKVGGLKGHLNAKFRQAVAKRSGWRMKGSQALQAAGLQPNPNIMPIGKRLDCSLIRLG
jgi:hypothetical protein